MFHVEHSLKKDSSGSTTSGDKPRSSHIVSILNQKGGVGKTTTVLNLATAFAASGKKCLLVDLDPQSHVSVGLGIPYAPRSLYSIFSGLCALQEVIIETLVPNLHVLPSCPELAGAEIELVPIAEREYQLKKILAPCVHSYDYIFLDSPPSLGLLTVNGLVAASHLLIPLQCEFYALEGLSRLLFTVRKIQASWNSQLELLGVLLTMYDRRCLLHKQVMDDARKSLKSKVLQTAIPRNITIAEAASHGKPVLLYDRHSLGAQAYLQAARYLLSEYSWVPRSGGTAAHHIHG